MISCLTFFVLLVLKSCSSIYSTEPRQTSPIVVRWLFTIIIITCIRSIAMRSVKDYTFPMANWLWERGNFLHLIKPTSLNFQRCNFAYLIEIARRTDILSLVKIRLKFLMFVDVNNENVHIGINGLPTAPAEPQLVVY